MANRVYVRSGYVLTREFKEEIRNEFLGTVKTLDFTRKSATAETINKYVSIFYILISKFSNLNFVIINVNMKHKFVLFTTEKRVNFNLFDLHLFYKYVYYKSPSM